ncbi:MAG: glycerophosphodiester phosphodiesterase [Flavobacteriales bacterium]|nr:glycerophosphodiester phosphodiesterase [Flavobacteriales bacterium]
MNKGSIVLALLFVFASCQSTSKKTIVKDEKTMLTKEQIKIQQTVADNIVIAHRGMPYHCPESTLPSYILAREIGADYLEADIQRTKDGVLVVFHDDDLKRTTNVVSVFPNRANEPISSFTLEELQKLDVGSWFNTADPERSRTTYEGLKIITLVGLIDIARQGINKPGLYLETKKANQYPGIEKDLFDVLTQSDWLASNNHNKCNLILQTFEKSSLPLLNQYFPETPKLFLLWKDDIPNFDSTAFKTWVTFGAENGAQFIGPSINGEITNYHDLMEPWMIEIYQQAGLRIHAYTFDTPKDLDLYANKMNGCFTNRADLLLDFRDIAHPEIDSTLERFGY